MKAILEAFGLHSAAKVIPINEGLIHSTYRAVDESDDILLQKINTSIFQNPEILQQNYLTVFDHLRKKKEGFNLPSIIKTTDKKLLWKDDEGNVWRAFSFFSNAVSYDSIANKEQAFIVGECYGKLSTQLVDLPFSTIQPTIPRFHDLSFRFDQFKQALQTAKEEIKIAAAQEIEAILFYSYLNDFYQTVISDTHQYRHYILHHDCKISNILFDKSSGVVICPVDLDTLMPGYFFSDLGDMIRSAGNNLVEDDTALEKMKVKKDIIEALEEGYSSSMSADLTPEENKWLPYSGHLLTYMQAMRFLTDFLNGNIYYHTKYSLHNLDRAKNQLRYLRLLMEWRKWPTNS